MAIITAKEFCGGELMLFKMKSCLVVSIVLILVFFMPFSYTQVCLPHPPLPLTQVFSGAFQALNFGVLFLTLLFSFSLFGASFPFKKCDSF